MFVDPGHWDDGGTPEDPGDDEWVVGDHHLLPDSPCVDVGDPDFLPGPDAVDLDGEPRIMACRIDMGVDEVTAGDPPPGDLDGSGTVDFADIGLFVEALLAPTPIAICIGDMNGDEALDGGDIHVFVEVLLDR